MITQERAKYLLEKWKCLVDFTKLSSEKQEKRYTKAILIESQEVYLNANRDKQSYES